MAAVPAEPRGSKSGGGGGDDDDGNVDFETQLRLEREEAAAAAAASAPAGEDASDGAGRTRVDEDGTVFDWDEARQAWFPRIDSEIQIRYQLGYGVGGDETVAASADAATDFQALSPGAQATAKEYWEGYYASEEYREWYAKYGAEAGTDSAASVAASSSEAAQHQPQESRKREHPAAKKKPSDQQNQWFEVSEDRNTHVYVQNLPLDLTEAEFIEFMSKCGMVLHDPLTRKPKVRLYSDSEGKFNGEARCGYIKKESVALAMQILDGYRLRDREVSVEPARFEPKAGFDPAKRRRLTNKEKKRIREQHERLLAWSAADGAPAGAASAIERRSDRVLVVFNAFEPAEFEAEPLLLERVRAELAERCGQFGAVRKAVLHDRNPQGVALVTFAEAVECGLALGQLNGRLFRGRVLRAEVWDGRAKYHVEETEEEAARRREVWERQVLGSGEPMNEVERLEEFQAQPVAADAPDQAAASAAASASSALTPVDDGDDNEVSDPGDDPLDRRDDDAASTDVDGVASESSDDEVAAAAAR